MFFRRVFNSKKEVSSNGNASDNSDAGESNHQSGRVKVRRNFTPDEKVNNNRVFNVIQLTPLWEHVIRTGHLPADINVTELFDEFTERLNDPEWQVRQHALRVLVDVLIILGPKSDAYFAPLIAPLVDNLGHAAPAVRKGALDALRVYIGESVIPENVLYDVIDLGINGASSSLYSSRLTVGVMLSLPSLVQVTLLSPKRRLLLRAAINALLSKIGEISYQEIALKILIRIRDLIGETEFYDFIPSKSRQDFDILCSVYGLNNLQQLRSSNSVKDSGIDINAPSSSESIASWQKNSQYFNKLTESRDEEDDDDDVQQISGITVLSPDFNNNDSNPLESDKDEFRWKINQSFEEVDSKSSNGKDSPRSEISTNNGSSSCSTNGRDRDGSCPMTHVSPDQLPPGKVIMETEIKINDDTAVTMRILEAQISQEIVSDNSDEETLEREDTFPTSESFKTSQTSNELENELEVRRTPKRVHFGGEIVKIRTPDSDAVIQSDIDDHIKPVTMNTLTSPKRLQENVTNIFINDENGQSTEIKTSNLSIDIPHDNLKPLMQRPKTAGISYSYHLQNGSSQSSPEKSPSFLQNRTKSASPHRRRSSLGSALDTLSPQNPHKPIEIMYNLQRSPLISPVKPSESPPKTSSSQRNSISEQVLPTKSPEIVLEPPQITSWEELDIVSQEVLQNLRSGDWRARSRAFEKLGDALQVTENFAKVQPCLDSLLRTLLSSEKNTEVSEEKKNILVNAISRLPLENLENRTNQILVGLCRQGGPNSNNIAKAMMQRMPAAAIVLKLLSEEFLHARSSRFRENALQMVLYALMTFPSTYFDVNNCVSRAVHAALDKKRRVRQAALDVIAVLGQISSPKVVIDVTNGIASSRSDGDKLNAAVKARLSRKQLPMIRPDDSVQYGLKLPSSPHFSVFGADVEWITSGLGSVSPKSSKHRFQNPLYTTSTDSDQEKPASMIPAHSSQLKFNTLQQPATLSTSAATNRKINEESWSLFKKSNSLDDKDERQDFSNNLQRRMGTLKEEPQLNHQSKSQSFPELSTAKYSSILKTSPRKMTGEAVSYAKSTISRLPIMEKEPNCPSENGCYQNPYSNQSTQQNWRDFGSSQGTLSNQNCYADSKRPVTYPLAINRPNSQTVRFSTPDKLQTTTTTSSKSADNRDKALEISPLKSKSVTPVSQVSRCSVQSNGSNDVAFGVLEEEKLQQRAPSAKSQQNHYENMDVLSELSSTSSSSNYNFNEDKSSNLSRHSTPTRALNSSQSITQQINEFVNFKESKLGNISRTMSAHTRISEKDNETRPKTSISLNGPIPFDEIPIKTRYSSNASLSLNQMIGSESPFEIKERSPIELSDREKSQSALYLSSKSLTDMDLKKNSLSLETKLEQIGTGIQEDLPLPVLQRARSDVIKSPRVFLRKSRKVSPMKVPSVVGHSIRMKPKEFRSPVLSHFERPKEALTGCINQLESSNWETTMLGLKNFMRLIRHHPEYMDPHIHILAGILAKHVRNLRSQVARASCQATSEFFISHRKQLETEADDLVTTLLHRTADTNKFLRKDAARALESMCDNLSIPKVVHLLSTRGACHQNALVRTTTSMLLTRFVANLGGDKVFYLNKDCRDKIIITGAQLLTEGSLETRNHAKQLFKLLSAHHKYQKVLVEIIPSKLYRNIEKTLKKV